MNKKTSLYEAPTTEVLVVRFEGAILTGSDTVKSNRFGETATVNDQSDAEDWWE